MTQDFLFGISTAMLIAFIAIIFIYVYYYQIDRKKYLLYWTFGWLFYGLRIVFLMITLIHETNFFNSLFYDVSAIVSAVFILLGTCLYFQRRTHLLFYFLTFVTIAWFFVANMNNWSFLVHHLIPSLIIGGMFLYVGFLFWKYSYIHPFTKLIGVFFMIMGLHKVDYPILRQVDVFAPFGYLINEILFISTAISIAMIVNFTLRKQLSESESRYQALANTSRDIIYSIDLTGNVLTANKQFQNKFNNTHTTILKKHISHFFPNTTFNWTNVIQMLVKTGKVYQAEYIVKMNHRKHYYQITLSPIFNNKGNVVAINGTHHDLTSYKEKEEMIQQMVYNDMLTELPNSYALYEHLHEKINKDQNQPYAVFYLGLDQFKKINDMSGPSVGDELLKMIGKSIELQIGHKGFVSRYAGDEFVIVTEKYDEEEIQDLLKLIKSLFQTSWILKHQKLHLSASIGVCIYPKDGDTVEDLLKNANMSLHYAKEMGKSSTLFYSTELRKNHEKNTSLEKALFNALENKEFTLFFQPQIHTKTNRLRGFEALIRWENPSVGLVSPNEFIPLAEKSGLIVPIGDWVIDEACKVLNFLHNNCNEKYCVSINISPKQIQQEDFVSKLEKAINYWKIPVNYLELEITEGVLIDSFESTIQKLNELYHLGVRLSLDDFGTGYSSFNYLTRLPIHLLKIDKSFTDEIHMNKERAIFLEKLIDLVKQMKLEVLVEGVEEKEQLEVLKKWQCDFVQGYYTSKPLPFNNVLTYIEKYA